MQSSHSSEPAEYYNLVADVEGIHHELRSTIRSAWLQGAASATLALLACSLAVYLLGQG